MTLEPPTNGSLRDGMAAEKAATKSMPGGDSPALEAILAELKAMRQELSATRSERLEPPTSAAEQDSQKTKTDVEYRDRLREIGSDYVDTRAAIQAPTGKPGDLVEATEILARAAAITEMCADGGKEMWPVAAETIRVASQHYATFAVSANALGVTDALAADDYYVLRHLDAVHIPEVDLEILRRAGVRDPAQYLRSMVRRARAVPTALEKATSSKASPGPNRPDEAPLWVVLASGGQLIQHFAATDNKSTKAPDIPSKKRKTWSAVGKILKGAAVAAGNLVPVVAAAGIFTVNPAAGALAAAGTLPAWDKILSSCGAGVGDICEGVGVMRGEG